MDRTHWKFGVINLNLLVIAITQSGMALPIAWVNLEEAERNLEAFANTWDASYPTISASWRANWARVTPFLAYPPAIRRVVYTTNAVESLNAQLRRAVRNRGSFPSEETAVKVLFLAVSRAVRKWSWLPVVGWKRPKPVRCCCRAKTGGVVVVYAGVR
jgi:transposase-like protein